MTSLLDPAESVIPSKPETLLSVAAMKYMAQADGMTLRYPQLQQEVGVLRKILTRSKFEGKDRGKLRESEAIDVEENPEDFQVEPLRRRLQAWKKWLLRIGIVGGIAIAVVISGFFLQGLLAHLLGG